MILITDNQNNVLSIEVGPPYGGYGSERGTLQDFTGVYQSGSQAKIQEMAKQHNYYNIWNPFVTIYSTVAHIYYQDTATLSAEEVKYYNEFEFSNKTNDEKFRDVFLKYDPDNKRLFRNFSIIPELKLQREIYEKAHQEDFADFTKVEAELTGSAFVKLVDWIEDMNVGGFNEALPQNEKWKNEICAFRNMLNNFSPLNLGATALMKANGKAIKDYFSQLLEIVNGFITLQTGRDRNGILTDIQLEAVKDKIKNINPVLNVISQVATSGGVPTPSDEVSTLSVVEKLKAVIKNLETDTATIDIKK